MGSGKFLAVAIAATALLAGCQMMPAEQTVGEYCANPDKVDEAVCKLKMEIDGNSTALADTDMRLSQARNMARADAAMALAEEANGKEVQCETRTIQNSDTGSCRPGYALTSCTQTRYTYRAGGMSILREINDEQCRFNSRVLEMQVRCCAVSGSAPQPEDTLIENEVPPQPPQPEAPKEPVPVSP